MILQHWRCFCRALSYVMFDTSDGNIRRHDGQTIASPLRVHDHAFSRSSHPGVQWKLKGRTLVKRSRTAIKVFFGSQSFVATVAAFDLIEVNTHPALVARHS